jgi:Tfp pilus assembly protein PilO
LHEHAGGTNVKRTLLWLIVAAVLVIGFVLYRSRSRDHLNVTPDAEREIEKAKRR